MITIHSALCMLDQIGQVNLALCVYSGIYRGFIRYRLNGYHLDQSPTLVTVWASALSDLTSGETDHPMYSVSSDVGQVTSLMSGDPYGYIRYQRLWTGDIQNSVLAASQETSPQKYGRQHEIRMRTNVSILGPNTIPESLLFQDCRGPSVSLCFECYIPHVVRSTATRDSAPPDQIF
ncbi:hypothetical protein BDR04DRAFT_599816 [Suillus decipiens]|nr:hypothetical protein BDR04DRAFT_599816 [Suillus decipiens]